MSEPDIDSASFPDPPPWHPSRGLRRAGVVLSAIAVLFLIVDAVMKILALPQVVQATIDLGFPPSPDLVRVLGAVLLFSTVLYAWPRTAALGAVLITGFLGGAISTHVRLGHPLFSHTLFGLYVAVFVWGGLYLRDARVRALLVARD